MVRAWTCVASKLPGVHRCSPGARSAPHTVHGPSAPPRPAGDARSPAPGERRVAPRTTGQPFAYPVHRRAQRARCCRDQRLQYATAAGRAGSSAGSRHIASRRVRRRVRRRVSRRGMAGRVRSAPLRPSVPSLVPSVRLSEALMYVSQVKRSRTCYVAYGTVLRYRRRRARARRGMRRRRLAALVRFWSGLFCS